MKQIENHPSETLAGEQGQSIVLIAAALIGLLAMVGLAVDVGLIYARGAQLQAAVDAAALAGVTEFRNSSAPNTEQRANADNRALQFLLTNEMPVAALRADWSDEAIIVDTDTETTPIGERRFSVDAYWTFDLFFLRIIGREQIQIMRRAQAGFFPLADIYASRRGSDGFVGTSNQGVFGPDVCTRWGDPFSPKGGRDLNNLPKDPNPDGTYSYTYRILVPKSYRDDNEHLQIELFDPDTHNQNVTTAVITRSLAAQNHPNHPLAPELQGTCTGRSENQWNPCLIPTQEITLTSFTNPNLTLDDINPYWIVKIDENRGRGPGFPPACEPESQDNYNENANTETRFQLYYFQEENDGTIGKVDLGSYLGKKNDPDNTDLRWVTPGITPGVNMESGPVSSFRLDLREGLDGNLDVPGILTDAATEDMYIYLDVTSISGSSENGFEIWAGPPPEAGENVPDNVNERNLYILNNPGVHDSEGVIVFAVGNLPMNSNFGLFDKDVREGTTDEDTERIVEVDIPLIFVGPEYAGADVTISLFDPDAGATPPILFYFDSVHFDPEATDPKDRGWFKLYGEADEGRCFEEDDIIDDRDPYACNNDWIDPAYEFQVPGVLDDCTYDTSNPETYMATCTPFYGGRLVARYRGGFSDTFGWEISVEGLPFLTE